MEDGDKVLGQLIIVLSVSKIFLSFVKSLQYYGPVTYGPLDNRHYNLSYFVLAMMKGWYSINNKVNNFKHNIVVLAKLEQLFCCNSLFCFA